MAKDNEARPNTDFIDLLMLMRNGQVAVDLNEKFNEVLGAVLDTGGKGELTIKIKVSPSKMGMGGAVLEVETEHETKLKKPELAIGKALFFVTKDGKLTREDPNQEALFSGESAQKPVSERRQ